jgi:ABC-type multidrug transport system ATPase subunit
MKSVKSEIEKLLDKYAVTKSTHLLAQASKICTHLYFTSNGVISSSLKSNRGKRSKKNKKTTTNKEKKYWLKRSNGTQISSLQDPLLDSSHYYYNRY